MRGRLWNRLDPFLKTSRCFSDITNAMFYKLGQHPEARIFLKPVPVF